MSSSTTLSNSAQDDQPIDPYLEANPIANPGMWRWQRLEHEMFIHERYREQEHQRRYTLMSRAATHWDEDQLKKVELEVASKLRREPELTFYTLRSSHHGTIWLRDQWKVLLERLKASKSGLSKADSRHAADLLGHPKEFRRFAPSKLDPPKDMTDSAAIKTHQRAVIEGEIALHTDHLVHTAESDRRERELVMKGNIWGDKEIDRLYRLQQVCTRAVDRLSKECSRYELSLIRSPYSRASAHSVETSTTETPAPEPRRFFNPKAVWSERETLPFCSHTEPT